MPYDYSKTITDTYADTVLVEAGAGDHEDDTIGSVYLTPDEDVSDFSFTPTQARSLAKALKQAANVAEGKPAKAKKTPGTYVDCDGDVWHLCPDGKYWCGNGPEPYGSASLDYVKQNYGQQA